MLSYIRQRTIAKKNVVVHFRVTGKMFTGPAPSLKETLKCEILELKALKQFGTTCRVPNILLLQKSLHPTAQYSLIYCIIKERTKESQGWEFAHSLIAHSLICSFRSNQLIDCE